MANLLSTAADKLLFGICTVVAMCFMMARFGLGIANRLSSPPPHFSVLVRLK